MTFHTDCFGWFRYFITFTNDFSPYGHVELIREKSDSLVAFKEFKVKMELQKNKKLKSVRSDIGGEFMVDIMRLDGTRAIRNLFT